MAGLVAYFVALELGPQTRILKNARDAICGGDQDFVFTTDGAGVPAWGFPETVDDVHFARDVNFGDLYGDQDKRTYLQRSVDAVIEQHGRVEVEDCPYDSCFERDSASRGGDDFREIFAGKTKRNRYRHAW